MTDLVTQPWFWPAVSIIVGLPLFLLLLTEVHSSLVRRGSRATGIVLLLRNFVLPIGALLLLISQLRYLDADWSWTRITATVLGFVIILVLLNGMNLALFSSAKRGSWRQRIPSIFVEIVRLVLIIVCVALLFAFVWGADIGGLFTAIGVGSIVIGLALQNAVGSVVSGLLLLFEQPFELGDWLDADGVRGQVVEVNWRSVHIKTDDGIRIVPNATLAGSSFENLSRSDGHFMVSTLVKFTTDDPPLEVIRVCREVAKSLPQSVAGVDAIVTPELKARYKIGLSLNSPSDEFSGPRLFKTRLWYAARRAGLHYDGDLTDNFQTEENFRMALRQIAGSLHLSVEKALELRSQITLERYGAGEVIEEFGSVPDGVRYILRGQASLTVRASDGAELASSQLGQREAIGLSSLTRQPASASILALTDLAVVLVPASVLDRLVNSSPELATDIGQEIDNRRKKAQDTLAALGIAGTDSRTVL